MKISVRSRKLRYIVAIFILIILGTCFIMRLPFMTETSPKDVDISEIKVDENGDLTFWIEVQNNNWFDYSGMESDTRWVEDEKGEKKKAVVCCLYKHFRIGGTNNENKKFLFKVRDLSELQDMDISSVYFGRDNDRILVWKQNNS